MVGYTLPIIVRSIVVGGQLTAISCLAVNIVRYLLSQGLVFRSARDSNFHHRRTTSAPDRSNFQLHPADGVFSAETRFNCIFFFFVICFLANPNGFCRYAQYTCTSVLCVPIAFGTTKCFFLIRHAIFKRPCNLKTT